MKQWSMFRAWVLFAMVASIIHADKPTIKGHRIRVSRNRDSREASVYWTNPVGEFTSIIIQVCEIPHDNCRFHEVNTNVSKTSTVIKDLEPEQRYVYVLILYHQGTRAYVSLEATVEDTVTAIISCCEKRKDSSTRSGTMIADTECTTPKKVYENVRVMESDSPEVIKQLEEHNNRESDLLQDENAEGERTTQEHIAMDPMQGMQQEGGYEPLQEYNYINPYAVINGSNTPNITEGS